MNMCLLNLDYWTKTYYVEMTLFLSSWEKFRLSQKSPEKNSLFNRATARTNGFKGHKSLELIRKTGAGGREESIETYYGKYIQTVYRQHQLATLESGSFNRRPVLSK